MRRIILASALIALALTLGGCGAAQKLGQVVSGATTQIVNPVTPVNMYQVKNVYAAGQTLVLEYKNKCFGEDGLKTFAQIQSDAALRTLCAHRVSRWRAMKKADDKAHRAIDAANTFIANNPSGNAISYVQAAWKAVNDFKNKATR